MAATVAPGATVRLVPTPDLVVLDADGEEVVFDAADARDLLALTGGLEGATVSACPRCRSKILAVVALGDLLADAPPFPRSGELMELADEAPTLHVYVRDVGQRCTHPEWRDPGAEEWADVMTQLAGPAIVK
jgi:D-serine deaminase-like pyridoxal phosphate-dependent protein